MDTIGLILAVVLGIVFGVFVGFIFNSILAGIIGFLIGTGYLFAQWIQAGVPYDIHDIANKVRDEDRD